MNQRLKTIAAICETHNPALKILVLRTVFNKRQNLDKIIRQQVEDFFGPSLVRTAPNGTPVLFVSDTFAWS